MLYAGQPLKGLFFAEILGCVSAYLRLVAVVLESGYGMRSDRSDRPFPCPEFDREFDQFNRQFEQQQEIGTGGIALTLGIILFVCAIALAFFAFWVWAIIDAARTPDAAWNQVGQNKMIWILALVLIGLFTGAGPVVALVYFLWPRPGLKQARQALASGGGYQ